MVSQALRKRDILSFDASVFAVGLTFLLMKTWQPAGQLYVWLDALLQWPVLALKAAILNAHPWVWPKTRIVMDATDLIALPVLLIPWWTGRSLSKSQSAVPHSEGNSVDSR